MTHALTPVPTADEVLRLDAPVRGELLSAEGIREAGRELAAAHPTTTGDPPATTPLLPLLDRIAGSLRSDNAELAAAVRLKHALSPATDWLLDNHYLIEAQVRTVRRDLPPKYGLELPRLTEGELASFPRVYAAALALIRHTDSELDAERLGRFMEGVQDIGPLAIGEVWAMPIVLRVALIENLRRLSALVVSTYRATRSADEWASRLILTAQDDPGALRGLVDELGRVGGSAAPAFYVRLAQRLQGRDVGEALGAFLARTLAADDRDLDELSHHLHQQQAADQVSIANTIGSIRFLEAYDWKGFFEETSFVEQILREDPSGIYQRMDFRSRDRYRDAVEMLARRCPFGEIGVAEATVNWALDSLDKDTADPVKSHVGHYLISSGRTLLEESTDYLVHRRERLFRGPLAARGAFYWGTLTASTVLLTFVIALYALANGAHIAVTAAIALLAIIPLSEIGIAITNRVAASVFPPRILPRLDFHEPIAEGHRTLVVVPALLSSVGAVRSVFDNLEVAYLANRDDNLGFALLGDLKAADSRHMDGDAEILEAALSAVEELNARYFTEHGREPFMLFMRGRTYSEAEESWMGWERKRGALVELNRALRHSRETSFTHRIGDEGFLGGVTFVLTLDADTQLPRDMARKLVSTIAHPMNRARWNPGEPRVREGYGLIQPRVSMSLPAASKSLFAWLHSGTTGTDPYAGAVSDTYQDVFGEGSFTGKGIYELNVFLGVMDSAIPENTLLSHDLLEGSLLRVGLASDIEVLDDHPATYRAHAARLHRWVRGDWQTLPWLGVRVPREHGHAPNPLSALHRWKIFDNLRRSMSGPALLLLLTVGWWLLPGPAWAWPLVMVLLVLFPVYFTAVDGLLRRPEGITLRRAVAEVWREFGRGSARVLLGLALLPHHAFLMLDATTRALWRMTVTHRKILEWQTAADAERSLGTGLGAHIRRLGPAAAAGVALTVPGAATDATHLLVSLPLLALFISGPFVAWRVSLIGPSVRPSGLTPENSAAVRKMARSTWRFFETFVNAEGNHLAPDNYQEDPKGEIAFRTSPTNMGLQLLCELSAYDLGYQTVDALAERTGDTLATMSGLRRFRGHFYNWYDTRTLEPLPPHYVSTVDSGNLAGHVLVVRQGLLEASEAPLLGTQVLSGVADTARLALEDLFRDQSGSGARIPLREAVEAVLRDAETAEEAGDLGTWQATIARWKALLEPAEQTVDAPPDTLDPTAEEPVAPVAPVVPGIPPAESLVRLVSDTDALLERLAPWAFMLTSVPPAVLADVRGSALEPLLDHVPSLVGLAEGLAGVLEALDSLAAGPPGEDGDARAANAAWARRLVESIRAARPECEILLGRLRLDAAVAREMWEHTDFTLLFDERRLLFSIGYNTAEGHLDPSYYDMLASECRLASFVAIAKGDVVQEHWFRLGRQIAHTGGQRVLLSWSASMFEYLMPLLVMRSWPLTLLDETYTSVVRRQIAYGRELGVPWGVSESAFNVKDANLAYQYQAFGVPGLGLKRGLSEDVVVAPYASALAISLAPEAALSNLETLAGLGARGHFGFYEALDFTPGRIPAGEGRAIVKAYMAHHQGMSFVAFASALTGDRMQERFHRDPMVASAELLLQERVPATAPYTVPHVGEVEHIRAIGALPEPPARHYPHADTPVPATHFLSNGRYSVMITNGGGGYSRWKGLAITRYREDVTRDSWGTFFYIRDSGSGEVWSAGNNPAPKRADNYHVTFSADKAEFRRWDGDIETHTEVAVSPQDDVEVRRVTISNHGLSAHALEVTSYFEVALTSQAADQAHKSFSNLFVETEAIPELHALLFSRRPRSSAEERSWGFHVLACEKDEVCDLSFETDRARFLGRLNGAQRPVAVHAGGELSGTVGAVLDPAIAMRRSVELAAGESTRIVFVTGAAHSRERALFLAERYSDPRSTQRAIDLSWTAAQIELRDLGIGADEAVLFQRLASRLLLTDPSSPLKARTPIENGLPLSGLWSLGISGDHPILLVCIEELEHAPLVRQALLAHQYWRHKGLVADLVILNTRPTSYSDELDDRLRLLVRTGHALQLVDKPGGIFLRRSDQMHPDVANLLQGVARAVLDGDRGSIELQLNVRAERPEPPESFAATREPRAIAVPEARRPALAHDNGYGGFDQQTGEYVVLVDRDTPTPAPWANVIASAHFGCLVSEAGIGCTWALNSHENRLTTWNNDPVSDGSGEVFYVRDEETGEYWSPTPLPCGHAGGFEVRHGFGHTRFLHDSHGIGHDLLWFVPADDPVRVARLRLTNDSSAPRRLSVTHFVEWVLGSSRSMAQHHVVTRYDAENEMLTAHNHYNPDFPGRSAFLACDRPLDSWTASRTEFVGRNRHPADPAAMHRTGLGEMSGRFHDNCGALMSRLDIAPGESADVTFLLGQTERLEDARLLVSGYRDSGRVDRELTRVRERWEEILGTVRARTPDPALDLLVNGRLLYQSLACRLWGRTATYQSSGAFGFRDQLQDTFSLIFARPDLVREQIVEASRHQFERGDVLHWWQPFSGRGVRTRISDDRHWLPLVTAEYVAATGDAGVLDVRTPFIEGPELEPDAEDAYLQPTIAERTASIYEHCVAALESGLEVGAHGLPLIGGGDWNDGMNRVGHEGRGESVWLAWFLDVVLRAFAPVCERMGEHDRAERYRRHAASLVAAAEREGWDGSWYRRAYFDDGTPLGTRDAEECRIDAIAQAWATISGQGDPARAEMALDSVEDKLIDHEAGLIALLTPPFDRMENDPGYIKGYVPGVRENGGQYTHAAVWVALAHLLRGDGDQGLNLLDLINPINHARTREEAERYKVEPYVVAADVYAVAPHVGRGGWTWYTGSASWFYRVIVQNLLGIRLVSEGGHRHLSVDPCIPKSWPRFEVDYRDCESVYRIAVENPRGVNRGVARVEMDGEVLESQLIPLDGDGRDHEVRVTLLGG